MITREQIRNLLNGIGDETISKSDADQMAADYPYFNIPQLLYLKFTPGAMPDEKRIQPVSYTHLTLPTTPYV